jgi:hypothetical protein
LKKILGVTVIPPGDRNDPLSSLLSASKSSGKDTVFLESAYKELVNNPSIKSMLEKKTLFDTIFSDMLAQPGTAGYEYLLECFNIY